MFKRLCLIVVISFCTVIIFNSCEKGTEPEKSSLKPGRRDYVWTEDTLDLGLNGSLSYRDIKGNSADNVWLGTLGALRSGMALWHNDGTAWKSVEFPHAAASALWLFEDNTLWVGSKENHIYKRENGAWSETYTIELDGYDQIMIFGLCGLTKNDIYAVGYAVKIIKLGYEYEYKGIILHFDGNNWKFIKIPDLEDGFHRIVYQENIKTFFIHGSKDMLDILYKFDGEKLEVIMSTHSGFGMSKIDGMVYINSNQIVYKYSNNSLIIWKDFTGTDFWSAFVGRSKTDFFNNSAKGLGHYNGLNYETIYQTNLALYSTGVFERDVFATAQDNNNNFIIIHGKLKN